jgi:hypothetical protein
MARKTPVSAVSIATATRDELNRYALSVSAEVGRRVSVSALVSALLAVGTTHHGEVIAALTPKEGTSDE